MMIDVAFPQIDMRAELGKCTLKAFRGSDRAQGTDEGVAQRFKRQLFTRKHILKIKRFVRALDHLRSPIVTADASHQLEIWLTGVFRDENVAGAPQIAWPLSQRAPGQHELVPKRGLTIHKHHVQPMLETEILKSIVEQKCVDLPFINGEPAAFHPVFIHDYNHIL